MRKLLIMIIIAFAHAGAAAQVGTFNEVQIRSRLLLNSKPITSFNTDSTFAWADNFSVPTSWAVSEYLKNKFRFYATTQNLKDSSANFYRSVTQLSDTSFLLNKTDTNPGTVIIFEYVEANPLPAFGKYLNGAADDYTAYYASGETIADSFRITDPNQTYKWCQFEFWNATNASWNTASSQIEMTYTNYSFSTWMSEYPTYDPLMTDYKFRLKYATTQGGLSSSTEYSPELTVKTK